MSDIDYVSTCLDNKVRGHARVRSTDIDYVSTCLDNKVRGHARVRSTDRYISNIGTPSTCMTSLFIV
jgi:hypothetical protein